MQWETLPVDKNVYSSRTGHTVITHKDSIYVFGGIDEMDRQNDMYKFNKVWSKLKTQGESPAARSGAVACVYEDCFFFFGGYTWKHGEYFNDLYRFNPQTNTWTCIATKTDSPPARVDHSFCNNKHTCYLFGGSSGTKRFCDMYELNLLNFEWKQHNIATPSNRFGHTCVFTNQLYIFGGWDGNNTLNDLWVFSNGKFKQIDAINPPAGRYRHTAVAHKQYMFVFGGVDQSQERFNDLHAFQFDTNEWRRIVVQNPPTPRSFHKCVVLNNYMYLIGGFDGQRQNDAYRIKLDLQMEIQLQYESVEKGNMKWMQLEFKDKFTPRTGHAACVHQGKIYLFGGVDINGIINNDLHVFDGNIWTKLNPTGINLQPRSGAKMVALEDSLLIFGGYSRNDLLSNTEQASHYNDLIRYQIKQNCFIQEILQVMPPKRTDHSFVEHDGSVYIFGGTGEHKQILSDLWRFKREWKEVILEFGISNRFGHIAVSYQNSMYVFGGWDGTNCLDDLYEYSYVTSLVYEIRRWSGVKPKPRYRHEALVYNDDLFIFGGVDYQQIRYNDLHQYNFRKREWRRITATGSIPSARTFHKFVNVQNRCYLFGGFDGNRLNDMYCILVDATEKTQYQIIYPDDSQMVQGEEILTLKEQVKELTRKIMKEEEKHLCKICFCRQIDSVLMECCHFILCFNCTESLKNCPICRSHITRVVRTGMY